MLDLGAIEARCVLATEGPWWDESGVIHAPRWQEGLPEGATCHPAKVGNGRDASADADFIANARTDIPDLIAENRKLRQAIEDAAIEIESALGAAEAYSLLLRAIDGG